MMVNCSLEKIACYFLIIGESCGKVAKFWTFFKSLFVTNPAVGENIVMVTKGVRIMVTAGHLRIMVTTEGV